MCTEVLGKPLGTSLSTNRCEIHRVGKSSWLEVEVVGFLGSSDWIVTGVGAEELYPLDTFEIYLTTKALTMSFNENKQTHSGVPLSNFNTTSKLITRLRALFCRHVRISLNCDTCLGSSIFSAFYKFKQANELARGSRFDSMPILAERQSSETP